MSLPNTLTEDELLNDVDMATNVNSSLVVSTQVGLPPSTPIISRTLNNVSTPHPSSTNDVVNTIDPNATPSAAKGPMAPAKKMPAQQTHQQPTAQQQSGNPVNDIIDHVARASIQIKDDYTTLITQLTRSKVRDKALENLESHHSLALVHLTALSDVATKHYTFFDTASRLGTGSLNDLVSLHNSVQDMLDILGGDKNNIVQALQTLQAKHDLLNDQTIALSSALGVNDKTKIHSTVMGLLVDRDELATKVNTLTQENTQLHNKINSFQQPSVLLAPPTTTALESSTTAIANASPSGQNLHSSYDTMLQQVLSRTAARDTNSVSVQPSTQHSNLSNNTIVQNPLATARSTATGTPLHATTQPHLVMPGQGWSNPSQFTSISSSPVLPSDTQISQSDLKLQMWKAQSVQQIPNFSGNSDTMSLEKFIKLFLLRYPKQLWNDDELCTMFAEKLTGTARQHLLATPTSCYTTFNALVTELDKRLNGEERLKKLHKLNELQRLQYDTNKNLSSFITEFEKLAAIAYKDSDETQRSFFMAQHIFSVLTKANWYGLDSLLMILEDELLDKYDRLKSHALMQERVRDNRRALSEGRNSFAKSTQGHRGTTKQVNASPYCFFCKRSGHLEKDCRTKANQQGFSNNTSQQQQTQRQTFNNQPHTTATNSAPLQQMNRNDNNRWNNSSNNNSSNNNNNNNTNNWRQHNGNQGNSRQYNPTNTFNHNGPQPHSNAPPANNRLMRTTDDDHPPPPTPLSARVTGWTALQSMQSNDPSSSVGPRATQVIGIFGVQTEALIDTGAQISTISASFIVHLEQAGLDIERLLVELPINEACQVYDASGNRMRFTMLLRTPVFTHPGAAPVQTVFHVFNGNTDDTVLLGTNALASLGIFLTKFSPGPPPWLTQSINSSGGNTINGSPLSNASIPNQSSIVVSPTQVAQQHQIPPVVSPAGYALVSDPIINPSVPVINCKTVVVTKRLFIPPNCTKMLDIASNGTEQTSVMWSSDESAVTSGVVSFTEDGSAKIPIHNHTSLTIRFLKQQVVGHTDSDDFRWKSISREDVVELLDHCPNRVQLSEHDRTAKLLDIITENNLIPPSLQHLVAEYADIFAIDDFELKQTHLVSHDIDTADATPIRQKARPMPMGAKNKFKNILDNLLEKGIVEPSQSPWSSPIVLVTKRDGSLRLCIDYRQLNKTIKLDSYPLPRMDDMLQSLNGKSVFSTLDLSAGFWQVPLSESSKEKTAFSTTEGLFQFKVLPFGLATSPATFQRLMATVLQDILGNSNEVQVYIDDFLIATDSLERHVVVLKQVFDALRLANLCLKPQKCSLMKSQVAYLGHRIDSSGVHPDPEKIRSVKEFPRPTCITEMRAFLGLCGYYRKFVHKFGAISKPLNELTSSSTPWAWNDTRQEAFQTLKDTLCSAPVLAQPNFAGAQSGERPFFLYTDACNAGVGAVLCQEGKDKFLHPIHFVSKSLNSAESKYTISDLEGLAVVHAVQRLRSYLYDMHVVVRTDHQPLVSFFKNNTYGRVVRWALALQSYNKLRIEYIQGKSNVVADALSRGALIRDFGDDSPTCQGQPECALLSLQSSSDSLNPANQWVQLLRSDHEFAIIIDSIEQAKHPELLKLERLGEKVSTAQFSINDTYLLFHTSKGDCRKVVPSEFRKPLFFEAHAGMLAGHFGPSKIIRVLTRNYFWPGLSTDVHNWHAECTQCYLANNRSNNTPPLKPILRGKPYELVAVDLLELGGTSSGNRYALVVIDHFSKFLGAYAIPNKSAETVAETLMSRWICEGARCPKEILSDKGSEFLNQLTETIRKITGITWVTTKGYNPRENGLVERVNATIKNALKKKVQSPAEWDKILPFVVYAYNTSPHESTGESPFFLLHAFDPPSVVSIDPPELTLWLADNVDYRTALVEGMQSAHSLAKEKLQQESEKMKQYYDHNNAVEKSWFPVIGDRVFLKNPSGTRSSHPKLVTDYSGPYRVLECSENSALIVDIKGFNEPIRVPFDRIIKTPDCIADDPVGITHKKRGRPAKVTLNSIQRFIFSSDGHLNFVGENSPTHPNFLCKGGVVQSALCSTHIGVCAMATMPLSQFLPQTAPGAETYRPGSALRLAQSLAAHETFGLTTKATDESLNPSASLVTQERLAKSLSISSTHCAHLRSALKTFNGDGPTLNFGLTKWGLSDQDIHNAIKDAKAITETAAKPPSKTLIIFTTATSRWTGSLYAAGIYYVKDAGLIPSKVTELLNDSRLRANHLNIIIIVDGEIPNGFSASDITPSTTRGTSFSIHLACAPHGVSNSKAWFQLLADVSEDFYSDVVRRNGSISTVANLAHPWTTYTVLGRTPAPPNRVLPEHRLSEYFVSLKRDAGVDEFPKIAYRSDRKRKNVDSKATKHN